MGLLSQATDAADGAASGVKVVTSVAGTAYSMSSLPLSTIVSVATLLLTLFYIWGALPRVWRTTLAIKRGLINHDWSLWQKLGDQPTHTEDD